MFLISLASFSPRARLAFISARQSRSWRHSAKALSGIVGNSSVHEASKASRVASKVAATRPPFAHPEGVSEMGDSFPLGRGRHHFFPTRS
ncbi:hypothetical protein, partial [Bradyrhizobium sp. MOS001]|uniref:hypothetical protein n=1 Tax=Bradyrhizobium sp. MOS001 TaxID=2133948 RepID=UPI00195FE3A5